jgi:hypothetical protein
LATLWGKDLPAATGISAELIEGFSAVKGDPDTDLVEWLRHGAPMGVTAP